MTTGLAIRLTITATFGFLTASALGGSAAQEPGGTTGSGEPAPASSAALGAAVELKLPAYKGTALANDFPVQDMILAPPDNAWLLTANSMWKWELSSRSLKRVNLGAARASGDQSPLVALGSDGLSLFAASAAALFQVQWHDGRIFHYGMANDPTVLPLGFAGTGDNFWLITSGALLRFDRYGKTLVARFKLPFISEGDPVLYEPAERQLIFAHINTIFSADFDGPKVAPKSLFKAQNRLLGLAKVHDELVAYTAHTVVRLDKEGKQVAAIPVEGRRELIAAQVTPDRHVYLFSDRLLEIYQPSTRTLRRVLLPVDEIASGTRLRCQDDLVALLAGGDMHMFKLIP